MQHLPHRRFRLYANRKCAELRGIKQQGAESSRLRLRESLSIKKPPRLVFSCANLRSPAVCCESGLVDLAIERVKTRSAAAPRSRLEGWRIERLEDEAGLAWLLGGGLICGPAMQPLRPHAAVPMIRALFDLAKALHRHVTRVFLLRPLMTPPWPAPFLLFAYPCKPAPDERGRSFPFSFRKKDPNARCWSVAAGQAHVFGGCREGLWRQDSLKGSCGMYAQRLDQRGCCGSCKEAFRRDAVRTRARTE
ncbi:hypothetical protein IE81DRAFT_32948 [Ceraceosorus guamensis]|uniref:Uncharacterized protein n=1 Tax=Ceraceosorus guamensis TaxID=1522189 RepID=A0A316VP54_9BASI|nr:hypothetical protein IE81DRAFT_32948 [Ceraceosorus guamensis]PWN39356.1 hypothetical protein IE81DRAFT_32948 [Ceraceosorus guamensis]